MLYCFEAYALDTDTRELKREGELVALEPQVFDLLVFLIENRDRVVSKDDLFASVWQGRIMSESTLTSRINSVRTAIGDSGENQKLIRTTARKGFRFIGAISQSSRSGAPPASSELLAPAAPQQEVHFCAATDDVRIAYALAGQGPPLVKAANWLNHLEYDWQSPIWSHLLHALARDHRLIRYDARGNGLSDWEVGDFSFDAFVNDLESVIDAAGVEKFALFGISQGCAVSIAYAVRNPERVTRLVLYGGFARGRRKRGSQQEIENTDAISTLMRQGWGQDNPAFRQLFTSLFIPGGTPEQMQWFNDLQRITASPDNAVRLRRMVDDIDIVNLLPLVKVPTLVLHCRNDSVQPFDEGRRMAAGIPGARFVALEGHNHLILESDPAWSRLLNEIRNFLKN